MNKPVKQSVALLVATLLFVNAKILKISTILAANMSARTNHILFKGGVLCNT
jgi:hypothetical protein